jgi:hypothetical protein
MPSVTAGHVKKIPKESKLTCLRHADLMIRSSQVEMIFRLQI